MANVAIISMHEKGFPQADLYLDASEWDFFDWESGQSPDDFITMVRGALNALSAHRRG